MIVMISVNISIMYYGVNSIFYEMNAFYKLLF